MPVDQISTLLEYSFFKATSGAMKINVPQCWSNVVNELCSYLALKPKSANLIVVKSFTSPTRILSIKFIN